RRRQLARATLLADGANQLGLAHLGAPVDAEPRGLAAELRHGHRACAAAGPLRSSALARGRLGPLPPERRPGLLREPGDGLLLTGSRLGPLDVLARGLPLLPSRHFSSHGVVLARV